MKPLLVGIAGGSCAGKTTLAEEARKTLPEIGMEWIPFDAYYKPLDHLPLAERHQQNFDSLEILDWELLAADLNILKSERAASIPVYDFIKHTRSSRTRTVQPAPVILVEGILLFAVPELLKVLDLKVFLKVPADIRLARRIERDRRERGRTAEMVIKQYLTTVRPMHEKFVEPSQDAAELTLGGGGYNPEAISSFSSAIRRLMGRDKHRHSDVHSN